MNALRALVLLTLDGIRRLLREGIVLRSLTFPVVLALFAVGGTVIAVAADLDTDEGRAALLAACPDPDILVNNNGGPPFVDFRALDRAADDLLVGIAQRRVPQDPRDQQRRIVLPT